MKLKKLLNHSFIIEFEKLLKTDFERELFLQGKIMKNPYMTGLSALLFFKVAATLYPIMAIDYR